MILKLSKHTLQSYADSAEKLWLAVLGEDLDKPARAEYNM